MLSLGAGWYSDALGKFFRRRHRPTYIGERRPYLIILRHNCIYLDQSPPTCMCLAMASASRSLEALWSRGTASMLWGPWARPEAWPQTQVYASQRCRKAHPNNARKACQHTLGDPPCPQGSRKAPRNMAQGRPSRKQPAPRSAKVPPGHGKGSP
jgi:hypothetical protein